MLVQETDRNKETARPVCPLEEVWKELQPRIVAVHDQFPLFVPKALGFDLREPSVLRCKCGGRVRFGEVENYIEKRGDRACSDGFHAWHGDCRRGSMSCKGYCGAVANEAIALSAIESYVIVEMYLCTKLMPLSSL